MTTASGHTVEDEGGKPIDIPAGLLRWRLALGQIDARALVQREGMTGFLPLEQVTSLVKAPELIPVGQRLDYKFEIHFHHFEQASVLLDLDSDNRAERGIEIGAFVAFALRILYNTRPHQRTFSILVLALQQVSREILVKSYIEDCTLDRLGPFSLVRHAGHAASKRFVASGSLDSSGVNLNLNQKGFGLLGKGLAAYAPMAVLALLRHLIRGRRGDPEYVAAFGFACSLCADSAAAVTATNQHKLSGFVMEAACPPLLLGVAATESEPEIIFSMLAESRPLPKGSSQTSKWGPIGAFSALLMFVGYVSPARGIQNLGHLSFHDLVLVLVPRQAPGGARGPSRGSRICHKY